MLEGHVIFSTFCSVDKKTNGDLAAYCQNSSTLGKSDFPSQRGYGLGPSEAPDFLEDNLSLSGL